ncbi:ATP-binding protein [Nocardiopsis sp. RSe5-2]|uniref:ATP-binding protein n=1 Tax=Nocardiopsis endophytica TaxID=3018445 RepID=A0ABT4TXR0_9ACTN|nr:ATP-binding protein [Nocardiopsis endophytica]MDA2809452.1 ATP-binding protein [Nocardiopsis endophytica]
MLLRFRTANHRSIRDEQTLSLVGTEFNEGTARPTPLRSKGRPVSALPVVGLFGANASGKSNVVSALTFMQQAVTGSFADWARHPDRVPRWPFKLDRESREQTSLFEIDLLLGEPGTRYTYGFEVSDERIEAEWLHAYPHGKRNVWFDRDAERGEDGGDEYVFRGAGFKGKRDAIVDMTRPNALFLSTGAALNDPQLSPLLRWFTDRLEQMQSGLHENILGGGPTVRMLADGGKSRREEIERLLAVADLGITGVKLEPWFPTLEGEEGGPQRVAHGLARVRFQHKGADGDVSLHYRREESQGTRIWFDFLGPMLQALDEGNVLLVDELDSSLHPTLAAEVVRIFQDPDSNPHGAQLIFTTHDVSLLGSAVVDRPLDRDQVWITRKGEDGATELYPVTDAKPRKEESLERGYLRGRYGGVPRLTPGEIAREIAQSGMRPSA